MEHLTHTKRKINLLYPEYNFIRKKKTRTYILLINPVMTMQLICTTLYISTRLTFCSHKQSCSLLLTEMLVRQH